jgi:(p)ppGpp synthase/HD superfamily hydrolase
METGATSYDWDLIRRAFDLAVRFHAGQTRKGTQIPYLSHVMAVATIVMDHGGTDVQVAAALLHDTAEDGAGELGGEGVLRDLADRLGPGDATARVVELVRHLSDDLPEAGSTKRPWVERKRGYLAHLADTGPTGVPDEALVVSSADKLHNARAIVADYRVIGEEVWDRFQEDRPYQLWYYRSLVAVLGARLPGALTDELARTVTTLVDLVAASGVEVEAELAQLRL